MRFILLATSLSILIASTGVHAGDLAAISPSTDNSALEIIFENHKGEQGRVVIDNETMIRAENEKNNTQYLLIDPDEPSLWLIDMGRQQRVDGHSILFTGKAAPHSVLPKGPGHEVVGRPTIEYEIRDLNDNYCSKIYIMPLDGDEDERLLVIQQFLSQLAINPAGLLPILGPLAAGLISPCVRAELDAMPQLAKIGIPVMRINNKGKRAFIVTDIRERPPLKTCLTTLPEHYESLTAGQAAVQTLKRKIFGNDSRKTDHISLDDCP